MKLSPDDSIHEAADLLSQARHAVVLTGAGISTSSGIPDFRSQGSGLWERVDPMRVASLTAFKKRPEIFFNWLRPLATVICQAEPNIAHYTLAELERQGVIHAVLTQNIDRLHQRAGTKTVIELHGSLTRLICGRCHCDYPVDDFLPRFIQDGEIPRCPTCMTYLKPDFVLYEEQLPPLAWQQAEEHARLADVMLIIGTALEVSPVNILPTITLDHGGQLIILTRSSTHLDDQAKVLLPFDISQTIPLISRNIVRA